MPEKCLFCGEDAVIEDTVADGSDQLICIECGTLANNVSKPSIFSEEDDDLCKGNLEAEDGDVQQSVSSPSITECSSCGVEFVSIQHEGDSAASSLKHQKKKKLCTDCVEYEDEEEEMEHIIHDPIALGHDWKSKDQTTHGMEACLAASTSETEKKCSSCGCVSLVIDSVNGDDRLVCASCGQVNSDAILTTDSHYAGDFGTTSSLYHSTTLPVSARRRKENEGLLVGNIEISCLCSKFCFSSDIKSGADDMYRRLYRHPKVLNISLKKKKSIAAMCLFIVCRRFDLPISVTHFRKDVASFSLFLKMKKFLQKLGITLPHISVTTQLTEVMDRLKFDHQLTNKVKDLLFLFREAWLSQGKNRGTLISIAAYYAFVSSSKCDKYITLKNFAVKHNLGNMSGRIARECQYILMKLAGSLPWIKSKKIILRALPGYIDSVLQYRESLFHLVFMPDNNVLETITSPTQILCPFEISDSCGDGECVVADQLIKKPLVPCSEKERLLPSALKKRKMNTVIEEFCCKVPHGVNLDSPILQENEFDEEISSYILSADERDRLREHKMNIFKRV